MWIIAVIIALLIWGNLSKKSASHPINSVVTPKPPTYICGHTPTAGDSFTSGNSIVSGVTEPHLHCNVMPVVPIHITMPIEPPPLAIQNPTTATPFPDGTLVSAPNGEVDLIQSGKRRWIPNPATFTAMGFDWNKVKKLTVDQFNAIPNGGAMPDLSAQQSMLHQIISPVAPIRPVSLRRSCLGGGGRGRYGIASVF